MRLTLPQQDIYFEQLLYPNDPIYNIGAKIEIKGTLNIDILKKAYIILINQHDAYRSVFTNIQKDNIKLEILDDHDSELGFINFSHKNNPIEEANVYMQKEFIKPFDLFNGKLLHVFTLVKVEEDFHYLFSVCNHIITDGWGTSLMFQRWVQNYNELFEFGDIKTDYPYSYKDFIEEDLIYKNSKFIIQDKVYWTQKFKTLPENLFNKIDDTVQINKSNRKELIVKRKVYNKLNNLAVNYKCSTFHLILGILYTYFGRKQQNNNFSIGLPVLNRSKSSYKKTVGLFMGISPLNISLDFDDTFKDLIILIKKQLRQDYRHQRFPLGKLIQELQLFNEKEKLFNITLSYEKQDYAINFQNTHTKVIPLSHQSERVALAIYIREFDELDDVQIDFDYNLNYFDELSIIQVVNHFEILINSILVYPENKLKELEYLTEKEKLQLLVEFNETKVDYTKNKTIIDLFEEQVNKNPKKEALKDDTKSYSYFKLNKVSNQIAEYLISIYGKEDKSPIAVLLGRSADMVAILLGILKSGRPYIPLDPNFPKDRLSYIIDNSKCKVLINEKKYLLEGVEGVENLTLENILKRITEYSGNIYKRISFKDTAYIIYTSGSTGNPKGVEVGHQSLLNFLKSIQHKPGVSSKDILFSVTTYSFDISILEFFTPLISGATLYVANQNVLSEPHFIIEKIEEIRPTIIQATPSFYQMLFNADWHGNKRLKILCGGDLLSIALAEKLINHGLEVWNMYGPTETTIWSSIKKIEQAKDAFNIGKPINNTQFYILDEFLNLKPIGANGAIYIGGDGLAKGYYKNESLTEEKFIQNPFVDSGLIYETGDLGKWNDDGEIEFLGRNDNQVKIRGYRIELGDIESHLNKIRGVKDSVVIAKKNDKQEPFLVAYILKNEKITNIEGIIDKLKIDLPYYMIPNKIILLKEFPLTPNKKIDRKSLSQREIQKNIGNDDFKSPISDLEKKLSYYWKEVLNNNEPISINDNFFAIGGHSLNAVKLIGLVAKHLLFNITLKTIFDYPTIESLANYLQTLTPSQAIEISLSKPDFFYNVTPSQYNIWIASQQKNISIAYNMFTAYKVEGIIKLNKITKTLNRIINKYEILRTNFIEINGVPYQRINSLNQLSINTSINELKDEEIEETINQLTSKEFDLEDDLLIRVHLLDLKDNNFVLLFCTHHIIMDGLSLENFIKEFIKNYNNTDFDLLKENTLRLQFKDYSEWFNKKLKENTNPNLFFWTNYLQNYQPKDTFDRDFDNKQNKQRGSNFFFELTPDVTFVLNKFAIEEQVTLYTVLLAALNILIYKYSDHNDICIGTVNSGRNISELNNQIGMFAKTLILRTQIKPEQTFVDILINTHDHLLKINDHDNIPFDKVPQSIFDTMFVYQNPEFSFENINELNDLKLISYPIANNFSRVPIVFNMYKSENILKGIIEYNSDLFEEDTIQIIAVKYVNLLNEIVKKSLMKVKLIDTKLEFEKNSIFDFKFNF